MVDKVAYYEVNDQGNKVSNEKCVREYTSHKKQNKSAYPPR